MSRDLKFTALGCVMDKDLPNLLRCEWSMGNGQCPECYGAHEGWLGHPCHKTMDTIGHKAGCPMARAIESLGGKTIYMPSDQLSGGI